MIPRFRPNLGWRELAAAFGPARRDEIARFERDFAELMGQRHAVAFPYGRTGLTILLEALGLKGREILCPACTCVVVPHAIVTSGNEPVLIDSRASDFNMDLDLAERAITPATGALVATSIFGYPVDLERLETIRRRHPRITIIQDCAHSFAAEWNGRPVQGEGAAAIFGLNVSKLLTSIFGGMVTTDRDHLAERLRHARDRRLHSLGWLRGLRRRIYLASIYPAFNRAVYGLTNRLERSGALDRFTRYYDEAVIDMPDDYLSAMTPIEARVGRIQIERYGEIIARRRQAAAWYEELLGETPALLKPPLVPGATYSHYVCRTGHRDKLIAEMLKRGVQLGRLIDYSIPDMPAYSPRPGSRHDCPVARQMAESVINLPLPVTRREAVHIASCLVEILKDLPHAQGTKCGPYYSSATTRSDAA